jgi:hypothetical protein
MTEKVWLLGQEHEAISRFLRDSMSARKLRLLAVAHCRQFGEMLPDRCRVLVDVAERSADGLASVVELQEARYQADNLVEWYDCAFQDYAQPPVPDEALIPEIEDRVSKERTRRGHQLAAAMTVHLATFPVDWLRDAIPRVILPSTDLQFVQDYSRDLLGNPFRPVTLDPRWLSSTVIDLARTIYDERVFERMPILADALMDAGCDSEEIISHCRSDGPHVRGCWVVDLLLAKN